MALGPNASEFTGIESKKMYVGQTYVVDESIPIKIMEHGIKNMTLKDNINHKENINFRFGSNFDGITVKMKVFYTSKTNASLYDSWTFPSPSIMDDFYFDKDTMVLMNTNLITVGKSSLMQTHFDCNIAKEK